MLYCVRSALALPAMIRASAAVRWLPSHCVESTASGGAITVIAYVLMLLVFTLELSSFFDSQVSSTMTLDVDKSPLLQINFDIDMNDIECRNLEVIVIDQQGKEAIKSLDKNYLLSDLDKHGKHQGVHKVRDSGFGGDEESDEEVEHKRLATKLEKEDGKKELDADWSDSHDGFKHSSFQHVIQYHDFTLINFFAEWCTHCRKFAPMWKEIAQKISEAEFDVGGREKKKVHVIKMNCVDFMQTCREQGIDAFPTIRLYRSDGTFSRFDGHRTQAGIENWVQMILMASKRPAAHNEPWKKHFEESEMGCNARGYLRVPKAPGHLEFFAGAGDQNLLASMTNVSHRINHLTFSDLGTFSPGILRRIPEEAKAFQKPLNNRQFSTNNFHEAWEHHLKVVRTKTQVGSTYQFLHYSRTARLNKSEVPQARFYYDLEPFAMEVKVEQKRWYDLSTSLLAVLGGLFVVLRLTSMAVLGVAGSGAGRKRNGLLT